MVIRYLTPPFLQSYTEGTIKTQGTYSLKGIAKATNSLNKTLTRTIASPLNLTNNLSAVIDIRASRTGSNIKIGLHDSGGTTTEITPNITVANAFQTATIDLSGVTNANKDAIDQIIITVVNADADNTFYLDNFSSSATSVNNTVTRTVSPVNISTLEAISFYVRSTVAGSFARFQFGETASTEQTYTVTINSANTWEQKTWNLSAISATQRDAVTKFAFQFTADTSGATFYFDEIKETNRKPEIPTLDSPLTSAVNVAHSPVLKTTTTDNDADTLKYKIDLCTNLSMTTNCQIFNQTATSSGWSASSYASGSQAEYTLSSPLSFGADYYWRSYAIDEAGTNTWSSTQATPSSFSIDIVAPSTVSSLTSTSHSLSTWSSNNTIDISWTAATDTGGTGVAGYSFIFDTSPSTLPDTAINTTLTSTSSASLSDSSSHYFHVRAIDNAGNWGATTHTGPYYLDTVYPEISFSTSSATSSSGTTITWDTNENASSIVDYGLTDAYGSSTTETDIVSPVTSHSVLLSDLVPCISIHFRVRSKDRAANETAGEDSVFTTTGCTGASTIISEAISNIATVSGGTVTLLSETNKGITIDVPFSFATESANFQAHHLNKDTVLLVTSVPSGYSAAGNYIYELKALTNPSTIMASFDNALTVTIAYDISDLVGLDETTLKIYRWDGSFWNQLTGCAVDTLANTVTCTTTHFSAFGLFGQGYVTPLGGTTSPGSSGGTSYSSECADTRPASTPDLFQINATNTSAKLFFTPISNTNTYYLSYSTNPNAEEHGGQVSLAKLGVQNYTVNLLKPGTTYYFKVRGQIGCMPGSWSGIMKITTEPKNSTRTVIYYKNSIVKLTRSLVSGVINTIKTLVTKKPAATTPTTETPPSPIDIPQEGPAITEPTVTQPTTTVYQAPIATPKPVQPTAPAKKKFCILWWCF